MAAVEGSQEKDVPCAISATAFANVDQLDFRPPSLSPFATYLQPNQCSSAKTTASPIIPPAFIPIQITGRLWFCLFWAKGTTTNPNLT
jgi:hypothetical protein